MTHVPSSYEVETFTGKFVDVSDPQVDTICVEDIAHSLSNICRYGGHCRHRYSVAQHAVFVSERLRRQGRSKLHQLTGLHHDDSEAYLCDVPRPIKKLFGRQYEVLTEVMDETICQALFSGLIVPSFFHDPVIKDSDNWALFVEAKHMLPSQGINWAGSQLDDWGVRQDGLPSRIITPDYWKGKEDEEAVEAEFLRRHYELMEAIR